MRGDTFADLTGGLGVDACFMSKSFEISHYVECQQQLCVLAEHNFATLGVNIKVFNDTAESFLQHCGRLSSDTVAKYEVQLINFLITKPLATFTETKVVISRTTAGCCFGTVSKTLASLLNVLYQ